MARIRSVSKISVPAPGTSRCDAVRKGFDAAIGDVLMILDADLTVPPKALPKFYAAITKGKGEFVNGTRLVYPMEHQAMRPLNFIANRLFAAVFSFLINQRFTDTLYGIKVLRDTAYRKIAAQRHYFDDFDPFGDFDLILGAAKSSLKNVEIPIHYGSRTYETQISRSRDGWRLLRMVLTVQAAAARSNVVDPRQMSTEPHTSRKHSPASFPSTSCRSRELIQFATLIACPSPTLNSWGSL